jgi:hypothetical protein
VLLLRGLRRARRWLMLGAGNRSLSGTGRRGSDRGGPVCCLDATGGKLAGLSRRRDWRVAVVHRGQQRTIAAGHVLMLSLRGRRRNTPLALRGKFGSGVRRGGRAAPAPQADSSGRQPPTVGLLWTPVGGGGAGQDISFTPDIGGGQSASTVGSTTGAAIPAWALPADSRRARLGTRA